jgi:acyl-CoA thioester hydrolase
MRDAAYPYREIEESGYVYPIIEIGIRYYNPLYYDDLIWIHTRPSQLERVKVRFNYIIVHGDSSKIICEGFTQHCAVNRGRPAAVDEKTSVLWKNFPE